MRNGKKALFVLASVFLASAIFGCKPTKDNSSTPASSSTPTSETSVSDTSVTSNDASTSSESSSSSSIAHTFGPWTITKEPTLTEGGTATRSWTDDPTHTEEMPLPVLTDTTVWTKTTVTAPTCEGEGKDKYTSEYGEVEVTVPATNHAYGEWVITVKPTLTATGTAERVCDNDAEHVDSKTLPALTDTTVWTKTVVTAPTCDVDGKDKYTSEYGEVEVTVPATNHAYGEWVITVKPTLTATGTAERVCDNDAEHVDSKTLPALTDTTVWTKTVVTAPTCEVEGKDKYTSEYGEVEVTTDPIGHEYGAWTIKVNPTATTEGSAERVCGHDATHVDTTTLAVLTDTTVWTKTTVTEPTCEGEGKDKYTSEYGEVEVTTDPIGHDYGAWVIKVNPTATTEGSAERVCSHDATHVDKATLPVLTDTTVWTKTTVTAPTCEGEGKDKYTSEYGVVEVTVPATNHAYGEWVITVKPTLTATGTAERVCDHDAEHIDSKTLPVLTDTTVWTKTTEVAPTCDEAGRATYTSEYGEVEIETDPAIGHTMDAYGIIENGNMLELHSKCSVCGHADAEVIASKAKPAVSTATYEVNLKANGTTITGNPFSGTEFAFTQSGNVFTSGNIGESSSHSAMTLTATSSGVIRIDYEVSSEGGNYDYFSIYKNDEDLKGKVGGKTLVTDTVVIEVVEGDVITLVYRKDSSGDKGIDSVVATVATSEVTTNVLKYETNGGNSINPDIIVNGSCELATPTKEGYYFIGWYTDATLSDESKVTESTSYTADTVVYAKWLAEEDACILNGTHYGMDVYGSNVTCNTYYDANIKLVVDVLGNYVAGYSYGGSNSSGTFTYNAETGTFVNADTGRVAYYDEASGLVVLPHDSTLTTSSHYSVYVLGSTERFYNGASGVNFDGGNFRFVTITVGDVSTNIFISTLTGEVTFGVSAYDLEGNAVATSDISNQLAVVIKKGDTVIGTYGYDGSKHVTADDKVGVYTIAGTEDKVYVSGAGRLIYTTYSATDKLTYTVVEGVGNKLNTTLTSHYNYDFVLDPVTHTVTVTENKYNVTYVFNGHGEDTTGLENFVWAGSWFYEPTNPDVDSYVLDEATGNYYVFKGWYTDEALTEAYSQTKITSDITLYAKWVAGHPVTFNTDGGNEIALKVVADGEKITLPTPEKTGYIFAGWKCDGVDFADGSVITGSVTLVAEWKEAPYYVGSFDGFNSDHSNFGSKTSTPSSYYHFELNTNGTVTGKATTKWSDANFDAEKSILVLDNGNNLYVNKTTNGIVFAIVNYSSLDHNSMKWDDHAFYVKTEGELTPSFNTIYWNNGFNKITEITLGEKVAYVYTDGDNKAVYVDVTFSDFSNNPIAFADIYNSTSKTLTNELVIKVGDTVVGKFKANDSSDTKYGYSSDDGKSGTYTGTVNGVASTVVLNGYGSATITSEGSEVVTATYNFESDTSVVITIAGKEVKFTVADKALTQVLDGVEGNYTSGTDVLVITGYGVCILNGASGTYTASGSLVTVTIDSFTTNYTIDKETMTFSVADLSKFAGYTFTGSYYDQFNEVTNSLRIVFESTAEIKGSIYAGYGELFYFHFTGVFNEATNELVLTVYDAVNTSCNGKTVTLSLSGNTMTVTGCTFGTNTYTFANQGSVTCADFAA